MPHYTILPAFLSTDAARSAAFFLLSLFLFFHFTAAIAPLPVLFSFIASFFRYFLLFSHYFPLSFPVLRPFPAVTTLPRPVLFALPPAFFRFPPFRSINLPVFFLLFPPPAPTVFPPFVFSIFYIFLFSSSLSSPTPLLFPSRLSTRIFSARSPPFP